MLAVWGSLIGVEVRIVIIYLRPRNSRLKVLGGLLPKTLKFSGTMADVGFEGRSVLF